MQSTANLRPPLTLLRRPRLENVPQLVPRHPSTNLPVILLLICILILKVHLQELPRNEFLLLSQSDARKVNLTASSKSFFSCADSRAHAATKSSPCAENRIKSSARSTIALSIPFFLAQLPRQTV